MEERQEKEEGCKAEVGDDCQNGNDSPQMMFSIDTSSEPPGNKVSFSKEDAGSKDDENNETHAESGSVDADQEKKSQEGVDDVDFNSVGRFHVVTKTIDTREKQDKEENRRRLKTLLKEEYLPYFVEKVAKLSPSGVEDIAFLKDDAKFDRTVRHLDNLFNELAGTKESYQFTLELREILVGYDQLFFAFRKVLEILFQNNLSEEGFDEPHYLFRPSFTYIITCLILNAADGYQEFARKVCEEPGLLELFVWLLKQLKERHLTRTRINESADQIIHNSLNILYNCSVFDENRQRMLEVGSLEACLPYLDSERDENQVVAFLCVAYLANEEQSEIFNAKRTLIEQLIEWLKSALPEPNRRSLGWHAKELVRGIGTLSRNDTNKKLIIDCGAIDVLLTAVLTPNDADIQAAAMKVLWTLSFDIAAKTLLKQNQEAIDFLDKIVSTVPKHPSRKPAKGILWNLRDAETYHAAEDPCQIPHIMISYQWSSKPLVLKVRDTLKAAGYKIWVDVDNMEGSTITAMAEAVEKSSVVLMFMSHQYKESQNCRSEAEYAYTRKKEIIPLVVEPKYKPDGWLGFIKGAKMYYDITNKSTFDEKMRQLIKALGSRGRTQAQQDKVSVKAKVKESTAPGATRMKNWDKNQVSDWMGQNGLESKNLSNLDGRQLHFLQRMLERAPEFYYSFVERNIHRLDEFPEFIALTNALDEKMDDAHSSPHF